MIKKFSIAVCILLLFIQAYIPSISHAAGILYVIDDVTDQHVVGDFIVSGGSGDYNAVFQLNLPFDFMQAQPFSPINDFLIMATHLNADGGYEEYALLAGQDYTLLKFKPLSGLSQATAFDGSPFDQGPHGDVHIKDLQDHLSANGILSTNSLFFGLKVDQDSDYLDIQSLAIKIFDGQYDTTYSLHKDFVRVYDPLRRAAVDQPPVPEPATIFLFGSGLLGFLFPHRHNISNRKHNR